MTDVPVGYSNSEYPKLMVAGTNLYLATSYYLSKTDGTAAGTVNVTPSGMSSLQPPVALGSHVLFIGTRGTQGSQLWSTDGTVAGTVVVKGEAAPLSLSS